MINREHCIAGLFIVAVFAASGSIMYGLTAFMDWNKDRMRSNECAEKGVMYGYGTKSIGRDCYFNHNGKWLDEYDLKRIIKQPLAKPQ